ncbi:MAG: hypothetical protein WAN11_15075 [Syntrophobacteraceae bacterium]
MTKFIIHTLQNSVPKGLAGLGGTLIAHYHNVHVIEAGDVVKTVDNSRVLLIEIAFLDTNFAPE